MNQNPICPKCPKYNKGEGIPECIKCKRINRILRQGIKTNAEHRTDVSIFSMDFREYMTGNNDCSGFFDQLNTRQKAIYVMLVVGMKPEEIGLLLGLSDRTIFRDINEIDKIKAGN